MPNLEGSATILDQILLELREVSQRLLRIEKRLASLEGTEGVLIEKMMDVRIEQDEIKRRTLDLERKSTQ